MDLVFVTQYDPFDMRAWSGTVYFMREAISRHVPGLCVVGNLRGYEFLSKIKKVVIVGITGSGYLRQYDPSVTKRYAKIILENIKTLKEPVVISPSAIPLVDLPSSVASIVWSDAIFHQMVDYYPVFSGLSDFTLRHGKRMDELILNNCALSIFTSTWAMKGAIDTYGVCKNSVRVIPYGANISPQLIPGNVEPIIENRGNQRCDRLFTGGDWHRKGGDVAVRVVEELNRSGLQATLHVVGDVRNVPDRDYVKKHGSIDKSIPSEARKYIELLKKCHFLLLPTNSDCTPMVFAEANAFGIPVVSTDTGGVPEIIKSGVNGALFACDDYRAMSEFIKNTYSNWEGYLELCASSRSEYRKRLNWDVAVGSVISEITSAIRR